MFAYYTANLIHVQAEMPSMPTGIIPSKTLLWVSRKSG